MPQVVEENNIVAVIGEFEEIGEQSNVKLIAIEIMRGVETKREGGKSLSFLRFFEFVLRSFPV
jgi:hypothetical protein